jgi:hypothetical protein
MPLTNEGMTVGSDGGALTPIMTEETTVRRVEDVSGRGFDWMDTDRYGTPDLAVKLFYDIAGVDVTQWAEEPSVDIYGDLDGTRDPSTGAIISLDGMGSAFKVFEAFTALDVRIEVGAGDVEISREALKAAQGQPFVKLRYAAREDGNSVYFNDFGRIYPVPAHSDDYDSVEDAKQALRDLFLDQYEDGWVDDFRPELIDEEWSHHPHDEAPEEGGATVPQVEPPASASADNGADEGAFEPEDNLPF